MPVAARKVIKVWKFLSSNGTTKYETLLYSDNTTSCDCPGWTRRAQRTCKHTRAVALGTADDECVASSDTLHFASGKVVSLPKRMIVNQKRAPQLQPVRPRRKLRFNETD